MKRKVVSTIQSPHVYEVLRKMRGILREIWVEKNIRSSPENQVVTLFPEGSSRGRVLFSYIIGGFLLGPDSHEFNRHTNIWQSVKMAETFVELGYEVDCIHWTNKSFVPSGEYAFLVDVRHNLERLAPLLNKDCIKIMHLDTAHILFHNAAEARRLLELQKRRGVTLKTRRFEMPNLGIEHADFATTTGNDFVEGTFAYAKRKIFKIPSPCAVLMNQPKKDWERCRKQFLWFSSSGLVHKGLDLALEAFAGMPDCKLTVCAPVDREKDFVNAYYAELYETPNIETIGWVDIKSERFRSIANSCVAILHLSCSEGGAPSVKTCMHAGLIPIVSYETGVDIGTFGFLLTDCSIRHIRDVVQEVTRLSDSDLDQKTFKSWEFARNNYTRERFSIEYRKVILQILEESTGRKRVALDS